jgi:hypothetical protein
MNGIVSTGASVGWPLHLLSLEQQTATVLRSFGPDDGQLLPNTQLEKTQLLTESQGGRAWSADIVRYRLSLWTRDGTLSQSLERHPTWFSGVSPYGIGTPTTPPPPAITAIQEDGSGRLWVFIQVAGPRWRSAWPQIGRGTHEVASRTIAFEKLFRTIVEVIDPKEGRVVARRSFDDWFVAGLPTGRSAIYSVDQQGLPHVAIVALGVSRR